MKSVTLVAVLALVPVAAHAQKPADVVHWSVKAPAPVKAGAAARIEIAADIEEGWHLYALTQPAGGPPPMTIAIAKDQPFDIKKGTIAGPAAITAADVNFGTETQYYEGKATFTVPVTPKSALKPGRHAVPVEITFQACNNRICLRPTTETLTTDVTIK
ncbi:MAG TPA: protein-disulfide reductase DsbD domain-containing protein [Vicinamibacterales bacterium]